jgi:glutamate racemase
VGDNAEIIDPAPAVARQVKKVLSENKLGTHTGAQPFFDFYTSGDSPNRITIIENILKETGRPARIIKL